MRQLGFLSLAALLISVAAPVVVQADVVTQPARIGGEAMMAAAEKIVLGRIATAEALAIELRCTPQFATSLFAVIKGMQAKSLVSGQSSDWTAIRDVVKANSAMNDMALIRHLEAKLAAGETLSARTASTYFASTTATSTTALTATTVTGDPEEAYKNHTCKSDKCDTMKTKLSGAGRIAAAGRRAVGTLFLLAALLTGPAQAQAYTFVESWAAGEYFKAGEPAVSFAGQVVTNRFTGETQQLNHSDVLNGGATHITAKLAGQQVNQQVEQCLLTGKPGTL